MIGSYTHGGDVFAWNEDILDYSISLNPMGMPSCAIEAGQRAMADVPRYPDPFCRRLTEEIARRDGVSSEMILCGNGASDLIDRLVRALKPREALLQAPTFEEYRKYLEINECKVNTHYGNEGEGFALSDRFPEEITEKTDLVFLCTPNNPTGLMPEEDLLRRILSRCREVGAVLVLDQCFLELCDVQQDDLTGELGEGRLVLLRALTKNFAMAPLRVGYCLCADRRLLERMAQLGQPWAVSVPAQEAAAAALMKAGSWPEQARRWLPEERKRLTRAFEKAGGKVYHGCCNFILLRWPDDTLRDRLLDKQIMLRQCGDFVGLDNTYFRACVRTKEENDRLIAALESVGE